MGSEHSPNDLEAFEPRVLLSRTFPLSGEEFLEGPRTIGSVVIADFDGDGINDVAAASGASLLLARGGSDGVSDASTALRLNLGVGELIEGDFDGDGDLDLIALKKTTFGSWVRLLRNDGSGMFSFGPSRRTHIRQAAAAPGNFDADTRAEFVLTGSRDRSSVAVMFELRKGHIRPAGLIATRQNGSYGTPSAGDLNGDGLSELIFLNGPYDTRQLHVIWNAAQPDQMELPLGGTVLGLHGSYTIADMNMDGRPDIVASIWGEVDDDYLQYIYIALQDEKGDMNEFELIHFDDHGDFNFIWAGTGASHWIRAITDVNGDGRSDILIDNFLDSGNDGGDNDEDEFRWYLQQVIAQPDGSYQVFETHHEYLDLRHEIPADTPWAYWVGDVTGDGIAELITRRNRNLDLTIATEPGSRPTIESAELRSQFTAGSTASFIANIVRSPRETLGVTIDRVEFRLDTNMDGIVQPDEPLIAVARSPEQPGYRFEIFRTYSVRETYDEAWGEFSTLHVLVIAIDSVGAQSVPLVVELQQYPSPP